MTTTGAPISESHRSESQRSESQRSELRFVFMHINRLLLLRDCYSQNLHTVVFAVKSNQIKKTNKSKGFVVNKIV